MLEADLLQHEPDVASMQTAADDLFAALGGRPQTEDQSTEEESDEDDVPDGNVLSAKQRASEMPARVGVLAAKLSEKKKQLKKALAQSRDFLDSYDDLMRWISDAEKKLADQETPSIELDKIKEELKDFEVRSSLLCLYIF